MIERRRLVREGTKMARAYRSASVTIATVTALTCLLAFVTSGRAAATAASIMSSIDNAGARVVVVRTEGGSGLDREVASRIASIEGVQWAVAMGAPRDVHNSAIPNGTPVSARAVYGGIPHGALGRDLELAPGQAVGTPAVLGRLGFSTATGAVTDGTVAADITAVIGDGSPSTMLTDYLLTGGWTDANGATLTQRDDPVTAVVVVATSPADVPRLIAAIRGVLGIDDLSTVTIDSSDDLVEVQAVVSGDFGALSRQLGLSVVGVGLAVVALTMILSVSTRRRDFGRRRALGASRSALLVLVAVQAITPAILGAVLGTALGALAVLRMTENLPTADLIAAVPVLATSAAVVGAIPAALLAALRDPVSTLRVP